MLTVLIVGCGIAGLAIGSFLNVVIYRVPRHESIIRPRSACPSCHTPILERDNIPVVSWLLLHGKCRSCQNPISARYPIIELTCAFLFAGAAARFGFNWELPAMLVFVAGLLALASIDLELMVLPKEITFVSLGGVGAFLLVASWVYGAWHQLLIAVLCSFVWFIVFFVLWAISPRLLGYGDVRLSVLLGLGLGWLGIRYVILGFFAANLIGAIIGIFLIATKKMTREQPIAYGVFLALGAALAIYAGPVLLAPFKNLN